MKKIMIAAAVVFCITAFADSARACSCIGIPIETHFQINAGIFIGEFVAAKHNVNQSPLQFQGASIVGPGTIDATFKVTRAVKGTIRVGDTVTIRTSDQGSACGITELGSQAAGTSWIIYAHQVPGGSMWTTGTCSPTKPAASPAAAEDLAYFDAQKKAQ